MKFLKCFTMVCIFISSNQLVFAEANNEERSSLMDSMSKESESTKGKVSKKDTNWAKSHPSCKNPRFTSPQIGVASFVPFTSGAYNVTLGGGLDVPITLNRTGGFTKGNIKLTPTGLKIGCAPGDYNVSYSITVQNPSETTTIDLQVALVLNGVVDLDVSFRFFDEDILPPGTEKTFQSTGILENVKPGTTLSLIGFKAGTQELAEITVAFWTINANRIPYCNRNN